MPSGQMDLKWALRTADMLAAYDVCWFEEALRPDDLEGFVELRRQSRLAHRWRRSADEASEFRSIHSGGGLRYHPARCDKGRWRYGTATHCRDGRAAWAFGYVGHGWNTALGLAADLQIAAGLPNVDYVEYIVGSRYVDGILSEAFELNEDGELDIPGTAGIGY